MITIERNTVNDITVQLKKDGAPVRLTGGESLTWCLLTKQSQVIAGQQNAIDLTVAGTDLKNGKVIITVDGTQAPYQDEMKNRDETILAISGQPVGRAM